MKVTIRTNFYRVTSRMGAPDEGAFIKTDFRRPLALKPGEIPFPLRHSTSEAQAMQNKSDHEGVGVQRQAFWTANLKARAARTHLTRSRGI